MQKRISKQNWDTSWRELSKDFKIIGPKRFVKKGEYSDSDYIGYGELLSYDELIVDQKSYFSPKETTFPVREVLFTFDGVKINIPETDSRQIILFLRACDIHGIHRLDTIFLNNGPHEDFYYKRLREKIHFFLIECTTSFDTCFCVSMGTNSTNDYAVGCKFSNDGMDLFIKDQLFRKYFTDGSSCDYTPQFVNQNNICVKVPPAEMIDDSIFIHELWEEYTRRCIACGRCNTSCVTCSCFTMQDTITDKENNTAERRRRWAGCHVAGFSDMAGGHSFRKKNGEKMRFKTMHKINDFYKRFGSHMCVGCGRCDSVCPEYISFAECINRVNKIVELKNNK
jgi:anaerobic sulfite reductase subunit A